MLERAPISRSWLENYRIRSIEQEVPGMMGGHEMRRRGQSLDFRDYQAYTPGADVRSIDWRASARSGGDLLVRSYVAEENLTLVISLDTRESMQLPEICSKSTVAAWISWCLGTAAMGFDDRVILHRIFGEGKSSIREFRGDGSDALWRTLAQEPSTSEESGMNLGGLERFLPPSSIWIVLTDFYFAMDADTRQFASRLSRAQDGLRWVIAVDLDSWPHERAMLGKGARRIDGPGVDVESNLQVEIENDSLRKVEERIESHKSEFKDLITRGTIDWNPWKWPEEKAFDVEDWFEYRFFEDSIFRRVFMRGK